MNPAFRAALDEAMRGGLPDNISLMRLLAEVSNETEARAGLAAAIASSTTPDGTARLQSLERLWDEHPQAWGLVRTTLAGVAHDRQGDGSDDVLRYWADAFDRLAETSPEASVALYSLGSADLLAAASAEIVTLLDGFGLLALTHDALDLGCGIGRLLVALAPKLRTIHGLDISPRMVEQSRRRCAALPNVSVDLGRGRNLDSVADHSLDLVIAADVFPYLVQAGGGLAEAHLQAFARTLRPGGAAVILNYSYRSDPGADRRDIALATATSGLTVERDGTADLVLWDARTFLLRR